MTERDRDIISTVALLTGGDTDAAIVEKLEHTLTLEEVAAIRAEVEECQRGWGYLGYEQHDH